MVKKKREGKVIVGWWVPKETAEAFRRAVFNKWGADYRYLGDELGRAMDTRVTNHLSHAEPETPGARTHVQLTPRSKSRLFQLAGYLHSKYTSELTDKDIWGAIREVLRADDLRTFWKYRNLLLDEKLIKKDRRADTRLDFSITTPFGKKRIIPTFIYKWEEAVK